MTPEQDRLLRESWRAIEPRREEVAASFYRLLCELHPDAGARFGGTDDCECRRRQGELAEMVREVVVGRDDPRQLVRAAVALGRRHATYGLRDEHYHAVGVALVRAIERVLGPAAFTPEVRAAWTEAYALLSAIMRRSVSAEIPKFVGTFAP
ncbi:MAG TPA: globin domain-containing protein [Gemmatimonadaceae bacterium]|nr:globin domain-containing protein [Gemmatimonadaceae bacterium]